ncbi:MAG: cobalamin biosynthesis protein [Gammaproteobacteria bacterium]|nr:MAG: cobalamin biosynthesis protein [Gammaproteobacteria bacterium]
MSLMLTAAAGLAAVLLDRLLGEPRRFHPLVGFGRLVEAMERTAYGPPDASTVSRRLRGALAVFFIIAPLVALVVLVPAGAVGFIVDVLVLYFALGLRSLHDHARPVADALRAGNEADARERVSLMVSRDSAALDITRAATESVLENGNDGVFGALFWFAVAGAPGALLYRLANTLDAMWGYRNERYLHFGWAAARLDDVLNYLPARLTALTYAILGRTRSALVCWRSQAPSWDSPNAGPVMAAGAGALGVVIGGPARYAGEWHERPVLGAGPAPTLDDIERALRLVRHGVWLWLGALFVIGVLHA